MNDSIVNQKSSLNGEISFIHFCGADYKSHNIRFKSNLMEKNHLKGMLHHLKIPEIIFKILFHLFAVMLHENLIALYYRNIKKATTVLVLTVLLVGFILTFESKEWFPD